MVWAGRAPRAFVVPRVLGPGYARRYSPYAWGAVFDARHHHRHVVYGFPALVDGIWVYEPHAYCSGHLVAQGELGIRGPRFGLHLGF